MKPLSIPSSKYSMDTFSAVGLHVLVVDDDPVCLMVLETMLKKCNYKVTTCNRANHALDLLRDNQEDFDIVLSDAYMPDVDGFKLLEIIGLKLDLPVIIMSANGDTSAVMKGITHGACDYLIKPVRMEELRNIWQHVIRRKGTDSPSMGTHSEWNDSMRAGELPEHSSKKRKEANELVQDFVDDSSSLKKARVNWSVHLHQQFVNAVNQLGVEKAVPKKLLDIMNVQGLTRENVASHLQKYRLYLKRLSGVVPEPCPIASFQASEDGISGGTMHVLPGRKNSTLPSVVKGLNLGAGLAGSSTGGQTIDAGIKKSLAQLNVSQKQKQGSANRAQVLGGLGLVDSHLLSTSHGGDLYRKSSLDLSFYPEEQKNDSPAWKLLPNPLGDLAASGFKGVNLEDEIGLRSHSSQIGGSTRQWKINLGGIHDVRPDAAVDLRMQGNQLNYSPEKMEVTCHEDKQAARHIEIPDDLSSTNLSRELSSCTPTEMTREGFSGPNNSLEGLSILMLDNFLQSPDQLNISDYLLDEAFPFDKGSNVGKVLEGDLTSSKVFQPLEQIFKLSLQACETTRVQGLQEFRDAHMATKVKAL